MWEMFSVHDDDHCGFLGQFEVRRLLKFMGDSAKKRSPSSSAGSLFLFFPRGLEPYKQSVASTTLGGFGMQSPALNPMMPRSG